MSEQRTLHPSYITDEMGKRVSVVLPLDEDTVDHETLVERLRSDGAL